MLAPGSRAAAQRAHALRRHRVRWVYRIIGSVPLYYILIYLIMEHIYIPYVFQSESGALIYKKNCKIYILANIF